MGTDSLSHDDVLSKQSETDSHSLDKNNATASKSNSKSRGHGSKGAKRPLVMKTNNTQHTNTRENQASSSKTMTTSGHRKSHQINPEANRWPFCIVWTPLPFVTWFIPIIGHTGVATSKGLIHDFSDDYDVTVDNFAFGDPSKYHQFEYQSIDPAAWDTAIKEASEYYRRTRHSLFFNNCHQYIATILNKVKYLNKSNWTQKEVWYMITFKSSYTDHVGFFRQWVPFTLILIGVIVTLVILF